MVGPLSVGLSTPMCGIRIGFVTCGSLSLLLTIPLIRSRALSAT
jgi:hypothetical protein